VWPAKVESAVPLEALVGPEELILFLTHLYEEFDTVISRLGVERSADALSFVI